MIALFTPASIVLVLPRMFSGDPRFLCVWGGADTGAALSTGCLVFQTMCMGVFFLFLCAVDWTWRLVGRRIEKTECRSAWQWTAKKSMIVHSGPSTHKSNHREGMLSVREG